MTFLLGRRIPDKPRKPVGKKRRRYVVSFFGGLANKTSFDQVNTFCLFIGYPRSGHTLIGSLLDAHPNVILGDELNPLKFIEAGFRERQIFHLLLRNSRRRAAAGRRRSGYSYYVPGQWQGRFEKLRMIGDKMGHGTVSRLRSNPPLLDSVKKMFSVNIKFVHVIRNPYDVISTMTLTTGNSLELSSREFFFLCESVEYVKQRVNPADVHDLWHEDFIASPQSNLKKLCDFFRLSCDDGYLDACTSIVFESPHLSRLAVPWTRTLIEAVQRESRKFDFLSGYSYD
jgi:hypothetical protein